jgi:hypothetical protein
MILTNKSPSIHTKSFAWFNSFGFDKFENILSSLKCSRKSKRNRALLYSKKNKTTKPIEMYFAKRKVDD